MVVSSSAPLLAHKVTCLPVFTALKLMHTAGWLHRDVSIGNILIDESGHARLVDLEYAKKMGDDFIPELRVVSVFFVRDRVYLT